MTRRLDFRLLPAAVTAWCAVFLLIEHPARGAIVLAAAAGIALCIVLVLLWRMRIPAAWSGQVVFILVTLIAVSLTSAGHLNAASSELLDRSSRDRAIVEVVARVTSDPKPIASWGGQRQFLVTLTTQTVVSAQHDEFQQVSTHLVLFGDQDWARVRFGSTVRTSGRVTEARDAGAREQFRLVSPSPPVEVAEPSKLLEPFGAARDGLIRATAGMSTQARGLVPGIGVGDRTGMSEELELAMRVTGMTHITAVSGSHFAIIAAAALAVTMLLRFPRPARIAVSAIAMAGFVLLVRPEPSVARAALMGGFVLAGMSMGRPSKALSALAGCVIALLLADPWLARSYGFILSVLATGALVLGAAPLTRFLMRWFPQWFALALAVPVVAQAVCAPVIILLEPSFAPYAVPANLLATPALAPASLCGVLAALLSTFWPAGAIVAATCASWATGWIAWIATFFANLPGAYPPWPDGVRGALLLAVLTVCVILVVVAVPFLKHAVVSRIEARRRPWLSSESSDGHQAWDS